MPRPPLVDDLFDLPGLCRAPSSASDSAPSDSSAPADPSVSCPASATSAAADFLLLELLGQGPRGPVRDVGERRAQRTPNG